MPFLRFPPKKDSDDVITDLMICDCLDHVIDKVSDIDNIKFEELDFIKEEFSREIDKLKQELAK